jgi:hypothetical protein
VRSARAGRTLLLAQVFLFAAAVPALARLKLSSLQRVLEPASPPVAPDPARVAEIVRAVDRAISLGSPFVRRGCLTRAITLYYFLRRAGLDVQLRFGMGVLERDYAGHCWLVKDGEPYLEARDPRPLFTEMYSIPQRGAAS